MSIGTDVKIGWDASAVKSGFASLRGMFNMSLRGLRQVGIGAARQMGVGLTDTLGRVLTAVPEGISEMMDWAGNLTDMSTQTGLAVSKIVVLEEALRMSGAAANDTSRILSVFKKNLYDASKEAGPARDALNALGFRGGDFKNMDIDKAFEQIGHAIANFSGRSGELEDIMSNLFGAKMGFKLIRFFKDFKGNMAEAEKNVGPFANRLDKTAASYDKMSDALARYKMRWRELMAIVVDQVTGMFGDDFIDKGFDWFSPEKIRASITFLREEIAGLFSGDGFGELFRGMGRSIGEGIRDSLKDFMPDLSPGGLIKGMFGGGDKKDTTTTALLEESRRQTRSLNKIERSGFPAVWA